MILVLQRGGPATEGCSSGEPVYMYIAFIYCVPQERSGVHKSPAPWYRLRDKFSSGARHPPELDVPILLFSPKGGITGKAEL